MNATSPYILISALLLGACTLDDVDVPQAIAYFGDGSVPTEVASPHLRRLTSTQIANSVRYLVGDPNWADSSDFNIGGLVADGEVDGFASNAASAATGVVADGIMRLAERVANRVQPSTLVSCDLDVESCRRTLVVDALYRGFRRPPTESEVDRYLVLTTPDPAVLFQAIVQSPHFLYLIEIGVPDTGAGPRLLTGYEIAARLSYALWDAPPDVGLMADAASGLLDERGGIERQARRMLLDIRARPTLQRFISEWFDISTLGNEAKSPTRFPEFSTATANSILLDSLEFSADVILGESGTLTQLLAGDHRAGLLTRRAWLAAHAHSDVTSPTQRGRFIRERLLCQGVPSPPGELVVAPLVFDPASTPRQQLQAHATDDSCSGCHSLMDPLGFAFEHYDAIGLRRDSYPNGAVFDLTGELALDGDLTAFADGQQLARSLSDSRTVRRCATRQWFRFALGRSDESADGPSLDSMLQAFERSGSIRELLVSLMVTDSFRYRRAVTP